MGQRLLTRRELEIVQCTAHGLSAVETGKKLYVSHETIKSHRRRVIQKLQARNMTHAVAIVCMNWPELIRASSPKP